MEEEDKDLKLIKEVLLNAKDYLPNTHNQYFGAQILIPRDGERINGETY